MLSRPTLVLNRSWMPVNVVSVRRAVVMLYVGSAMAVDPDTYEAYSFSSWSARTPNGTSPHLESPTCRLPVPEVIILNFYNKTRLCRLPFSRRNLYVRDCWTCQYCGTKPGHGRLTVDHVIPLCQHGKTSWDNCVTACTACNRRKAGRTPEQAGMRLLRVPQAPPTRIDTGIAGGKILPSWKKFIERIVPDVEVGIVAS